MVGAYADKNSRKFAADAGIAIGPILFIIAVLGILAAAIAAGSGSFTTGTSGESNRTKASAIIEIGQNLKVGFDRVIGNGIDFNAVVINEVNTATQTDLFSPTGGGIAAPSTTMANDAVNDHWYYVLIDIPHIGTGTAGGDLVSVLRVSSGVCDEINLKAAALSSTPAVNDLGDFTSSSQIPGANANNWPSQLQGKPTGCVQNNDAGSTGFYFYQVMGIR